MAVTLETDYLVIGSGASGMAFVDELVHNMSNINVIIIDKHAKPGGHWNDAYDFVTLHQPAEFYGVNSKPLGQGGNDLATYAEIQAYYEQVMKELVASGRVRYYPQCEYKGEGVFHSMMEPEMKYKVKVFKKTVDATYVSPSVPSTRKPEFQYSNNVHLVPINGLSYNSFAWEKYVIIGGGKTGIDAVLYLLKNSVRADRIAWIVPNDYWFLNRIFIQMDKFTEMSIQVMNCVLGCESHEELFQRWERIGFFMRLDNNVEPKNMKGATVTAEEMEQLRLVRNVVRNGRVDRIEANRIVFNDGSEINTDVSTLHVDCTACGSKAFVPQKVFNGKNIILQDVRQLQTVYSAALIAVFESRYPDEEERKNKTLKPIFHPMTALEYIIGMKENFVQEDTVVKEIGLRWLRKCRLNSIHHISICSLIRYIVYVKWNGDKLYEALDKMVSRIEGV